VKKILIKGEIGVKFAQATFFNRFQPDCSILQGVEIEESGARGFDIVGLLWHFPIPVVVLTAIKPK